ncbi:hypothetical protein AUR61_010625 [Stutzerimonas balearica]|nr:hypothetical protein AUR61_010625 [Stutzerimonas balearica]
MPPRNWYEYWLGWCLLRVAYWFTFRTWCNTARLRRNRFGYSLEADGEIALLVAVIRFIYVFVLFQRLPEEHLHILQLIDAISIDIGVGMPQAGFK